MRFAVLLLAALLGAAAFYLWGDRSVSPGGGSETLPTVIPLGPAESTAPDTSPDGDNGPVELETLAEVGEDLTPAEDHAGERERDEGFEGATLVRFHGSALLQHEGQRPNPAIRGTIEVAILNDGRMIPVSIPVNLGQFSAEVPERCRMEILGGVLEDQTVRFLGFEGQLTVDHTQPYAFVGEPIPVNRLRVFEGTQRIPLSGITVRRHTDATTALGQDQAPVGEVILENAASPVELPFIPATHPIWLHVSVEGYATTALLLDPREINEKDVVLWPAAGLVVRVTGRRRSQLKALILHRLEPGEEGKAPTKRHFATLNLQSPGITSDTDAIIFTLKGIPALPVVIEARGFDKRGRETRLGTVSTELGPLEARTVELRIQDA